MKRKRNIIALMMTGVLLCSSFTAFASDGLEHGTTSMGKAYTSRFSVSSSKVTGSSYCSTAQSCGVQLSIDYYDTAFNISVSYDKPVVTYEPDTSSYDEWNAGSNRIVKKASISCYVDDVIVTIFKDKIP